jgi:hypothetical protein
MMRGADFIQDHRLAQLNEIAQQWRARARLYRTWRATTFRALADELEAASFGSVASSAERTDRVGAIRALAEAWAVYARELRDVARRAQSMERALQDHLAWPIATGSVSEKAAIYRLAADALQRWIQGEHARRADASRLDHGD